MSARRKPRKRRDTLPVPSEPELHPLDLSIRRVSYPEEREAWDRFLAGALTIGAPREMSLQGAVDAAAQMADYALSRRRQRFGGP